MFGMRRQKEPQYRNSVQRSVAIRMRWDLLALREDYIWAGMPSFSGPDVHKLERIRQKVENINKEYSEFGEPLLELDKSEAHKAGKQEKRMGSAIRDASVAGLAIAFFADAGAAALVLPLIGVLAGAAVSFHSRVFTWIEAFDSAAKEALAEAVRLGNATLPEIQKGAVEFYERHAGCRAG